MGITFNGMAPLRVRKDSSLRSRSAIVPASEWTHRASLKQRIQGVNLFIDDLYHHQQVLRTKSSRVELIESSKDFITMHGSYPLRAFGATLLARPRSPQRWNLYVLEDNLRCRPGVSYVLQNRQLLRAFSRGVFALPHTVRFRLPEPT